MSIVEPKPIITRAQWDQSPKLATRTASQVILDAARHPGPTGAAQAKQAMAEVIGHALSAPSPEAQDLSIKDVVLATVSSNQALAGFSEQVGAAWRTFTVTRNLCSNSSAASAARLSPQAVETTLAGARATFDQTVARHVDDTVRKLTAQPPSTPDVEAPSATTGEVVNMLAWATANRRKR